MGGASNTGDWRGPDRRSVLRAGAGALAWAGLGGAVARAARSDAEPRVLVLLQLTGGNDGLSTIVPWGDDAYHRARHATRIEEREVLTVDELMGFHPGLPRLHARFLDGGLAVVHGVGYPSPNRSHFKSLEIWHTADARGRAAGDGWVGRLCEEAFGHAAEPNRVVHLGAGAVPYSLFSSTHPPASFSNPAGYRWVHNEDELAAVEPERSARSDALALIRARMHDARDSSAEIRAAAADYRTPVAYPDRPFAEHLRTAAALVNGGVGTRVVSVELDGFDTHTSQRGRHDALMAELDAGLAAFLADLDRTPAGRSAVVLAYSEFGRRVAENGSRGTDHGKAGPMLVAGGGVRAGFHGRRPSLDELDEGDLVHTTDFRSVYAEAIEACFGVRAKEVLGQRYPSVGLFG